MNVDPTQQSPPQRDVIDLVNDDDDAADELHVLVDAAVQLLDVNDRHEALERFRASSMRDKLTTLTDPEFQRIMGDDFDGDAYARRILDQQDGLERWWQTQFSNMARRHHQRPQRRINLELSALRQEGHRVDCMVAQHGQQTWTLDDGEFTVTLPMNYPIVPPRIQRRDGSLVALELDQWSPAMYIVHILLQVHAQML